MSNVTTVTMSEAIEMRIHNEYGDVVEVKETEVKKNNGTSRRAFVISREGSNLSPTIYYQDRMNEEENIELVVKAWGECQIDTTLDMNDFFDFDKIKGNIIPRIVNRDRNDLSDIPHRDFLDLAIEYCYYFPEGELTGATILIHNSHLEYWNKTVADLDEAAWENRDRLMGFRCRNIFDYLSQIYPEEMQEMMPNSFPLWVVSNNSGLFGAVSMADIHRMTEIFDKLGKRPLLVFPSSIHEVIVMPDDGSGYEYYREIVQVINSTELPEQDILSDSVYRFDGEKLEKIA